MILGITSIFIAALSLALSIVTAWWTYFRRGEIKAAQPPTLFFGPDGKRHGKGGKPKLFLRLLLFATARNGRVIESIYTQVRRGQSSQIFNIWVFGEKERLRRGSGLHVGPQGVAHDHHFLMPPDGTNFEFLPGDYTLRVFAKLVDEERTVQLVEIQVSVTDEQSKQLRSESADTGLYFDWGPETGTYSPHLDHSRPLTRSPIFEMAELLKEPRPLSSADSAADGVNDEMETTPTTIEKS